MYYFRCCESKGFPCTGSLLALNSFENRVYQIGIEEAEPLIVKFYKPLRWSSQAILEEHQFSFELAQHDIPIIDPLLINNESLHFHNDFWFALFPRRGGHALELNRNDQLEWMGRLLGRLHCISATRQFKHRIELMIKLTELVRMSFSLTTVLYLII